MTISVRVTGLRLAARIGINADEFDRFQPIIVSVDAVLKASRIDEISQSIDYRAIARIAEDLALGHIGLIETFAFQLATRCLDAATVTDVEVEVEKPGALANGLAGTRVRLSRAAGRAGSSY